MICRGRMREGLRAEAWVGKAANVMRGLSMRTNGKRSLVLVYSPPAYSILGTDSMCKILKCLSARSVVLRQCGAERMTARLAAESQSAPTAPRCLDRLALPVDHNHRCLTGMSDFMNVEACGCMHPPLSRLCIAADAGHVGMLEFAALGYPC